MDTDAMRKFLFVLLAFTGTVYAEGPIYRHKDAVLQLEFENAYQDLRRAASSSDISSSTLPGGATSYIQNSNTLQSGATAYPNFVYTSSLTVTVNANANNDSRLQMWNSGTGYSAIQNRNILGGAYANLVVSGSGATGSLITGVPAADLTYLEMSGNSNSLINTGSPLTLNTENSSPIVFRTNSTTVSSMTANGEILQPLQPSFQAIPNGVIADVTGDGTAYTGIFAIEVFDQGSDFNAGTGVFTAPVSGRYFFAAQARVVGCNAATTDGNLRLVTSNQNFYGEIVTSTALTSSYFIRFSGIVDMDANDTASVVVTFSGSTKICDFRDGDSGGTYTSFSGSLIN